MSTIAYHPDPQINAEVEATAIAAEKIDLAAGYPPSRWTCPECEHSHDRGHFGVIGSHRCLNCGYAGGGGVISHAA